MKLSVQLNSVEKLMFFVLNVVHYYYRRFSENDYKILLFNCKVGVHNTLIYIILKVPSSILSRNIHIYRMKYVIKHYLFLNTLI